MACNVAECHHHCIVSLTVLEMHQNTYAKMINVIDFLIIGQ